MRDFWICDWSGAVACAAAVAATAAPVAAQGSYSPYAEARRPRSPATCARSPPTPRISSADRAGKAALELGAQAAAGFFARADDVNPKPAAAGRDGCSPLPTARPKATCRIHACRSSSAHRSRFGSDRGLAYDLLGRQAKAQADYRAAIGAPTATKRAAGWRLAWRSAATRAGALKTLAPLMAKGGAGAARAPAFVFADRRFQRRDRRDRRRDARQLVASRHSFRSFQVSAAEKAAAVILGIFRSRHGIRISAPVQSYAAPASAEVATDRLTGIDDFLRPAAPAQLHKVRSARPAGARSGGLQRYRPAFSPARPLSFRVTAAKSRCGLERIRARRRYRASSSASSRTIRS